MNTPLRILMLTLAILANAHSEEWILAEGGQSPDQRFKVAVFPQKTEFIDEADDRVLLVDSKQGIIIGPLVEVSSGGGTWGATTENVRCEWSADSRWLAVNCRVGRLMWDYQLYRIDGRRAIPCKLPDPRSHPKGKIMDVVGYTANPGAALAIHKDGSFVVQLWGLAPKEGYTEEDYAKFGIKNFSMDDGGLQIVYRLNERGELQLMDVIAIEEGQ